jgi:hypothetical protein
MGDDHNMSAADPTFVAAEAAEIHARLIEAEDPLMEGHEARAALLIRDCVEDMNDLTREVANL